MMFRSTAAVDLSHYEFLTDPLHRIKLLGLVCLTVFVCLKIQNVGCGVSRLLLNYGLVCFQKAISSFGFQEYHTSCLFPLPHICRYE